MNGRVVVGLILFTISFVEFSLTATIKKFIKIQSFKACGKKAGYINIENTNSTNIDNTFHFKGRIEVLKDIVEPLKLYRKLERCDDTPQLDTCIIFKTMSTKDFCRNMNNLTIYRDHFFKNFKPEMKCPLVKGTYDISKAFIDISEFLNLPVENKIWRQTAHLWTHSDKLVYCSEWLIRITAQSSRKSDNKTHR